MKGTITHPGSQTRSLRAIHPWHLHLLKLLESKQSPSSADSTTFISLKTILTSLFPFRVQTLIPHHLDYFDGLLLSLPLFPSLQSTSMLPQRWVIWPSHLFSRNPFKIAPWPAGWRVCFLVLEHRARPLPTSPAFHAIPPPHPQNVQGGVVSLYLCSTVLSS